MTRCNNNLAFVFDLDKTIGYFTQIAIFIEGIEEYLQRKITLHEFFKLLNLYPENFRPNIFSVFRYLIKLKKKNKCVKVLIYSNNIGPKSWVNDIRKYIEYKLKYKLFDKTIGAWKVGNVVYEKCRTTHDKTWKEIIKCGRLKKNSKICFLDDQRHPDMIHRNIKYLYLHEYHHDILFEKMVTVFLNSKLGHVIKKNKRKEFNRYILDFAQNDPLGFRYIERSYTYNYNKKEILKEIKSFVKKEHFKKLSKNKKRKLDIQKKQHGTRKTKISS